MRQTRSNGSAPGAAPGICAASRSPRRPTARPAESHSGTAASVHSDASGPKRRCRNGCWALSPSRPRLAPTPRPKCCSAAHMSWEVSMESETRAPRARHNRRGARPTTGRCIFAARATWGATWAARPAWARRCAALLRAARRAKDQDRSTAEDWAPRVPHDGACGGTCRLVSLEDIQGFHVRRRRLVAQRQACDDSLPREGKGRSQTRCGCESLRLGHTPAALQLMI